MSSPDLSSANQLRAANPNILFIISRSKNGNLVVYEALLNADGSLRADKPVDVYWMDIDPEFVAKRKKAGRTTDRTELNTIEKQFAYGLSAESIAPSKYKVTLVALKERPVIVFKDEQGLHRQMTINGVANCEVHNIYVHSVDRMIGLPKVIYVEVRGVDPQGNEITERINYDK